MAKDLSDEARAALDAARGASQGRPARNPLIDRFAEELRK